MPFEPRDTTTALIHLYRGELGRMTTYRVRLDATTNWAVVSTAGIATFALGTPGASHLVFGLAVLLILAFCVMEARRFRGYVLIRDRVRLLETGFYGAILGGKESPPHWQEQLREQLIDPSPLVGYPRAIAICLRRSYAWLLGVVYLAWLVKLRQAPGALVEAASLGSIPGPAVLALSTAVLLAVVIVALLARHPEEG